MYPFDLERCHLKVSKHLRNTRLRTWGWDYHDVRDALRQAYRLKRLGRRKFEAWVQKDGSKKLIFVYDEAEDCVFVITATEG